MYIRIGEGEAIKKQATVFVRNTIADWYVHERKNLTIKAYMKLLKSVFLK